MVAQGCDAEAAARGGDIPHDHLFKVTGLSSNNLQKLAQEAAPVVSDFEAAIAATQYGRFNILLLACSLPAFWSAVSVTSSVSYIFTRAKCDMDLSLLDMGTVTAITYAGMIMSAMIWGFLSDTLGRRYIMVWGFLGAGVLEVAAALSQSFAMLLVTRFFCGFLFNGPFAVLLSYIAELHRTEHRARALLLTSMFYTLANTTLPLLAWAFLTHPEWDVELFGGQIVIHAWNLFLLATALMPLLSGVAFVFLPESPKFLMSRGRNEEAMAVFRGIYSMNTGRPGEEYPIEKLHSERAGELAGGLAALRGGGAQLAPLFRAPHACWLLLLCGIHVGCMFGSNTLRLWYPQLAAMIGNHVDESLCSAIAPDATPPLPADWEGEGEPCQPIDTDMVTYLQSVIVGSGSILTYGIGGMLVNKCGKKLVTAVCCWVAAALIMTMPVLGAGAFSVVALVTAALAFTSLSGAALSSIPVDLFPTDLRVMALAIYLMTGRMGTILGTVAFPALMDFGCYPPFIAISGVLIVCGAACLLLPNTTLKRME